MHNREIYHFFIAILIIPCTVSTSPIQLAVKRGNQEVSQLLRTNQVAWKSS